nr:reverse transcriptase domain-containing protein [Tanacetum cinerariifolium]
MSFDPAFDAIFQSRVRYFEQVITPATAKAVEKTCVICGGAHAYYDRIATDSNQPSVYTTTGSFFQNQASTSGTLPSNIVPKPKGEMKVVTTRSGLAYEGPSIPTNSPLQKSFLTNKDKLFELDKVPLNENCLAMLLKKLHEKIGDLNKFLIVISGNRSDRLITCPKGVAKDVYHQNGQVPFPTDFVVVDFKADRRVPLILGRSFLRTGCALINVYEEEITLRVNDESITFNLNQTMRYSLTYDDNFVNRVDVNDIAYFLKHESIPTRIEDSFYDPEGDILYLEKLLNDDSFQLPSMDLKQAEETKAKSSIKEPSELELKELRSLLEYDFLEESDKLPVIIATDLKVVEKKALIKVLKSHKRVIAWKISDIKCIDPRFCTHKILIKEDYKPAVQSQRRVNPKIHDMIKKEVIKLLDAVMIYPISDSPWVSPIHCVPKKGGMTIVANENNELIPTRLVTGWRVCIDYKKLNDATRKDHFSIKVDRGKVDVIAKLPHPTTVKGVRSFLGHVGFYRRFIQEFSKIARHMTHLLEKETPFVFSKDCVDAFETLKKKLTEASILVVPDWNLPFKLMCDANDFAIGATMGDHRKLQLNELNELRDQAYKNSLIYKERTKKLYDSKIKTRIFNVGDQVLLFNSRLKIFSGKLKTRWSGPFTITQVFLYQTVELSQPDGSNFKVNGHRVKHYFRGDIPSRVVPDLQTFPMDK